MQPAGPQTPPLQASLQQSAAAVHALPLGVQRGPPVLLLALVVPLLLELVLLDPPLPDVLLLLLDVPPSGVRSVWSALPPQPLPRARAVPTSAGISEMPPESWLHPNVNRSWA